MIKSLLTITGHGIWRELSGNKAVPIRPNRPRHKMIARGGSLAGRASDPFTLCGRMVRNLERLIEELEFHEVRPSVLMIAVAYHEDHAMSATIHLPIPTDRFDLLLDAARLGLKRCYRKGKIATHMHIVSSDFRRVPRQQSLFDPPDQRLEGVAKDRGPCLPPRPR